jgi:hypothetical protein
MKASFPASSPQKRGPILRLPGPRFRGDDRWTLVRGSEKQLSSGQSHDPIAWRRKPEGKGLSACPEGLKSGESGEGQFGLDNTLLEPKGELVAYTSPALTHC